MTIEEMGQISEVIKCGCKNVQAYTYLARYEGIDPMTIPVYQELSRNLFEMAEKARNIINLSAPMRDELLKRVNRQSADKNNIKKGK